jgi:hypothetical protein
VLKHVGEFVREADARYTLNDVVENGNFVVAFARSTGNIGGQRMEWDLCEVLRYEEDEVAEVWALRGGPPRPTSTT